MGCQRHAPAALHRRKRPRTYSIGGSGSSVGITTELRAGRSGIESRWGRDFPPVQTGPVAHPTSCKMGTGSLLGVKSGRGVLLTTHPLLVPRSCKSRVITLPTLWATPGLKRGIFTFNLYAPCILYIGQTYRYSPQYACYIFSQQIYLFF